MFAVNVAEKQPRGERLSEELAANKLPKGQSRFKPSTHCSEGLQDHWGLHEPRRLLLFLAELLELAQVRHLNKGCQTSCDMKVCKARVKALLGSVSVGNGEPDCQKPARSWRCTGSSRGGTPPFRHTWGASLRARPGRNHQKKEETLQSALKISCFPFGFGFNTSGCVLFLMHQHRSD